MATKHDTSAEKKKRQFIVLAVGGVILLALAAIQGPKLFGGSSSTAEPAEEQAAPTGVAAPSTGATNVPGATGATVGSVGEAPAATTGVGLPAPTASSVYLGGVAVTPAVRPPVLTGQLWSFNRFKAKDPFVPQVTDDDQPVASAAVAPPSPPPAPAATQAPVGSAAAATGPAKWATITVNGSQSSVQAKGRFPQATKTFVLVSLTRGSATVAPAGGKLAQGKTVTLAFGNPVTLVDAATGKRYALELVYTGSKPEQVTAFSG